MQALLQGSLVFDAQFQLLVRTVHLCGRLAALTTRREGGEGREEGREEGRSRGGWEERGGEGREKGRRGRSREEQGGGGGGGAGRWDGEGGGEGVEDMK